MVKTFVEIKVKPEYLQEAIDRVTATTPAARKEQGNLCMNMYQSIDDPTVLVFDAEWETKEDLDRHSNNKNGKEMAIFWAEAGDPAYTPIVRVMHYVA